MREIHARHDSRPPHDPTRATPSSDGYAYDAFVSYSRADAGFAQALQRKLERMLAILPWRRTFRLFRDTTNLTPQSQLGPSIEKAIDASRHFILLASDRSAGSEWVDREVQHYLQKRGTEKLFITLLSGTTPWTDRDADPAGSSLPKSLRALATAGGWEPVVIDFRPVVVAFDRGAATGNEFLSGAAALAAAIRGVDKDEIFGQHITNQRRALWALVLAGAVLLASALIAVIQSVAATRAKDLAQERLESALSVAHHINFVVDGRLKGVGGAGRVREELLESSRELLTKLTRDSSVATNESALYQRAVTAEYQAQAALEVHNLEAAIKNQRTAVELAEKLHQLAPRNTEWEQALSVTLNGLGALLRQQGRLDQALECYRRSYDSRMRRYEREPTKARARYDVAVSELRIADVMIAVGKSQQALAGLEDAITSLEVIAAAVPEDRDTRRNLASAYAMEGTALEHLGREDEAGRRYASARAVLEALLEAFPNDSQVQRAVVAELYRSVTSKDWRGETAQAAGDLDRAFGLASALVDQEPSNTDWVRLLAVIAGAQGDLLNELEDLGAAREKYREQLRLSRRLLQLDPDDVSYRTQLAASLDSLGDLEYSSGDRVAAGDAWREGLEIRRSLAASPVGYEVRAGMISSLEKIAGLHGDDRQWEQAFASLDDAERTIVELDRLEPAAVRWRRERMIVTIRRGDLLSKAGRRREAESSYLGSMKMADEALATRTATFTGYEDAIICRKRLYALYVDGPAAARSLEKAEDTERQILALAERMAQLAPASPEPIYEKAGALFKMGLLRRERSNPQPASKLIGDAYESYLATAAMAESTPAMHAALWTAASEYARLLRELDRGDEVRSVYSRYLQVAKDRADAPPQRAALLHTFGRACFTIDEEGLGELVDPDPTRRHLKVFWLFAKASALSDSDAYLSNARWAEGRLYDHASGVGSDRVRWLIDELVKAARALPSSGAYAADRARCVASALALNVLADAPLALEIGKERLAGRSRDPAEVACAYSELLIANGSELRVAVDYAERCARMAKSNSDRLAAATYLLAAAALGADVERARDAEARLVAAVKECEEKDIGWTFDGLGRSLGKRPSPLSNGTVRVLQAVGQSDVARRRRSTPLATRHLLEAVVAASRP